MTTKSKDQIIKEVIAYEKSWDGYLEKSWPGISYIYEKTKGAGSDNVVWMWKEAYESGFPNLQGSYWCAIWKFMAYVHVIGLEDAQKLFHQTWFINCQSLFETFRSLERNTGKQYIYSTPAPGRIYLHWNGSRHNHTEDVIRVSDDETAFWTNGGNTSVKGAVPNGGGVHHMKQYSSYSCIANGDHFIELDWDSIASNTSLPELQTYAVSSGDLGLTVSVDSTLNIRDFPKTGKSIGSLKNGERVFPDKKAFVMGDVWYYLPDKKGWISARYLNGGWVYEATVSSPFKWWYIHKNYTCTVDDIEIIGGKIYKFDEEGYMMENTSGTYFISSGGELIFP